MRAGLVGSTLGAVSAGEQNWYPIDMVGWFTEHVREGVEVTAGQLGLLAPALAEPYRLDDATVARIVRVHFDQAADLVLFQNQADRWNAMPGLDAAQRAAVAEYVAVIDELARLNVEVLAAAERLKPVTIEALLVKSDLEVGIEAVVRGWAGPGFGACAAPAGSPCRTGKGKVAVQYHTARFRLVPSLAKALNVPTPAARRPGSAC